MIFENKNPGEEKPNTVEKNVFFSRVHRNFSKTDYIVGHNANHNNTKSKKKQFLESYQIKNAMESNTNRKR